MKFDRSDEATETKPASQRLQKFTQALWEALVPAHGEARSVQGELVRANERLQSELLRNGLGNYYGDRTNRGEPITLRQNHYGALLYFMLDTLIENRGAALDEEDVEALVTMRELIEPDWARNARIMELEDSEDELSEAEANELSALHASPRPDWGLLSRAERCIANWCLVNHVLVDRNGSPVQEQAAVTDVRHVFEPPPPPPQCPLCKGKGWIAPADPSDFPKMCACKASGSQSD